MTLRAELIIAATATDVRLPLVEFRLHNDGDTDLTVLTWYTPLEGLCSDCLKVTRNGQRVAYDGPLPKRGQPSASEFLTIPAGGFITVDVQIERAYDMSEPGEYHVVFDSTVHTTIAPDTGILARRTRILVSNEVIIKIQLPLPPTDGAKIRLLESLGSNGKEISMEGVRNPKFVGGSSDQQEAVSVAFKHGYALTIAATSAVIDDAKYREWFGKATSDRLKLVRATFENVQIACEQKEFTYNLKGEGCKPDWYAYTYKKSITIWLCSRFWTAPAQGSDSQAGTVLHELTHAVASTDDIAYSQDGCRALAKTNPEDAVRNADNYEYFAGG